MSESPAFLSERLKTEGEKTVAFFASLTEKQWQSTVYTEDANWTMRNVLAHFVTAEKGFVKLFADILAGGPGATDDFDIDRYNARQQEKTADLTPQQLLEEFKSTRAEMAAWVATLSEPDLEKQGRHPFLGVVSLGEMIKMIYRHNQLHQRDSKKTLGEG